MRKPEIGIVLFVSAFSLACNTDPTEPIDETEAKLARSPDFDHHYDPEYLDDLAGRMTDVFFRP